jgi:4-hydroxy-tetrahydrodipicolinate synthase
MPRSIETVRDYLRDVCLTTTSPFRQDDITQLHEGGIHRNLDYVAEQGIRTVVPCGNTGEFHSLTLEECAIVTRETVTAVGSDCCVISGIGYTVTTAIAMARKAAEAGADGVMIVQPNFTFESPAGLKNYYMQILDALPLPAIIYKRNTALPDTILVELVQHKQVAGVKYAVNDINAFRNIVLSVGKNCPVVWICGTAERWAPFFFQAGAEGFSSGMGNFAPGKSLAMRDALKSGQHDRAMEIREMFVAFESLRALHQAANNVPAVKYAMDKATLYGGPVRPPISDLTPEDAHTADALVRQLCIVDGQ